MVLFIIGTVQAFRQMPELHKPEHREQSQKITELVKERSELAGLMEALTKASESGIDATAEQQTEIRAAQKAVTDQVTKLNESVKAMGYEGMEHNVDEIRTFIDGLEKQLRLEQAEQLAAGYNARTVAYSALARDSLVLALVALVGAGAGFLPFNLGRTGRALAKMPVRIGLGVAAAGLVSGAIGARVTAHYKAKKALDACTTLAARKGETLDTVRVGKAPAVQRLRAAERKEIQDGIRRITEDKITEDKE